MLAVALGMIAYKRYGITIFMINIDDQINLAVSLITILYLAFLTFKIAYVNFKYANKLDNKNVRKKYDIYFEEISSRNYLSAFFLSLFVFRRLL